MSERQAAERGESTEYVLTWESIDPHEADMIEARLGRHAWPRLSWEQFTWHNSERVASADSDILDQHRTLADWAETRTQPIRNVRLETVKVTRERAS